MNLKLVNDLQLKRLLFKATTHSLNAIKSDFVPIVYLLTSPSTHRIKLATPDAGLSDGCSEP